eukprot:GHVL01036267.1.p1 GENE.GHVL01036267.1~~GHVL01036267.1.p1  ORF type:complete len:237 (-),score=41.78 GHVL01036267.1:1047-1757(-)
MSATPTSESFIGSRISLISNQFIRYEGTLVQMDEYASTITLQNASSFGCEGRRVPPVAPLPDNIHTIIFTATDIEDLKVMDKPCRDPEIMGMYPAPPSLQGNSAQPEMCPVVMVGQNPPNQFSHDRLPLHINDPSGPPYTRSVQHWQRTSDIKRQNENSRRGSHVGPHGGPHGGYASYDGRGGREMFTGAGRGGGHENVVGRRGSTGHGEMHQGRGIEVNGGRGTRGGYRGGYRRL